MLTRSLRAFVFATVFVVGAVQAQTCAPFTDVAASNIFCSNIQWMFNRGVTLGCGPNLFCPSDVMPREQMAAFMNRLADKVVFQQGGNAFEVPGQPGVGAPAVLGTTNNQPLEIRVNGTRVMRYEPNGSTSNVIGGHASNGAGSNIGATIGGGGTATLPNTITSGWGTIAGGFGNIASALASVGGGDSNHATNFYTTIPGGFENVASGHLSFAAGSYARADASRCVVFSLWADEPGMPCFGAVGGFNVGAPGGYAFDFGAKRPDGGGTRFISFGRFAGQTISTSTGAFLSDGGQWINASDEARKDGFVEVDKRDVLARLVAMPIRSWRYKVEHNNVRHLGPTAQDFKAAFQLGEDDKGIGTVDADGVALAAIQGLNAKLEAKLDEQTREIAELRRLNDELRALVLDAIRR